MTEARVPPDQALILLALTENTILSGRVLTPL